jgi:hypothetical protein
MQSVEFKEPGHDTHQERQETHGPLYCTKQVNQLEPAMGSISAVSGCLFLFSK